MTTPWNYRYALRTESMGSSIIRELLKLTEQADVISFAGGLPAPEVFPVEAFQAASDKVLREMPAKALQYSTTEGYLPLRQLIVQHMARHGILAHPENVLITSGSQQALDLIGRLLINPGDKILTERPTYLGALQAWAAYQARYVTVPIDQDGLRTELLEEALRAGPKFMYILPNFQNPGGVTLTLERRMKLVQMADHYGVPIIEDDPYGQLRYSGDHLPSLVQLDCENLESRALRRQGLPDRQHHLHQHLQQDAGARPAAGLDRRAGGCDRPLRAVQAGHGSAHQHLHPDGGLRGRPGRPAGPARQADPRGVHRAARRDAGSHGSLLPQRGDLDAARRRAVPVGLAAGTASTLRNCSRKRSSASGSPSCPATPSIPTAAARTPCASTSPWPGRR